jgi:hypothetical protein
LPLHQLPIAASDRYADAFLRASRQTDSECKKIRPPLLGCLRHDAELDIGSVRIPTSAHENSKNVSTTQLFYIFAGRRWRPRRDGKTRRDPARNRRRRFRTLSNSKIDSGPTTGIDQQQGRLVGPAGIEPATLGLEIRCSIRLSYGPALTKHSINNLGRDESVVYGLSIAQPVARLLVPTRLASKHA